MAILPHIKRGDSRDDLVLVLTEPDGRPVEHHHFVQRLLGEETVQQVIYGWVDVQLRGFCDQYDQDNKRREGTTWKLFQQSLKPVQGTDEQRRLAAAQKVQETLGLAEDHAFVEDMGRCIANLDFQSGTVLRTIYHPEWIGTCKAFWDVERSLLVVLLAGSFGPAGRWGTEIHVKADGTVQGMFGVDEFDQEDHPELQYRPNLKPEQVVVALYFDPDAPGDVWPVLIWTGEDYAPAIAGAVLIAMPDGTLFAKGDSSDELVPFLPKGGPKFFLERRLDTKGGRYTACLYVDQTANPSVRLSPIFRPRTGFRSRSGKLIARLSCPATGNTISWHGQLVNPKDPRVHGGVALGSKEEAQGSESDEETGTTAMPAAVEPTVSTEAASGPPPAEAEVLVIGETGQPEGDAAAPQS